MMVTRPGSMWAPSPHLAIPPPPQKKKKVTLILTDDLDFSTKRKGFSPSNIYVKYKSSITYHSKAMAKVKVFCRQTNRKTDRQTERQKTICSRSIDAGA